jgi:Tol biopolymer transport system component/tRNA A-37 threonylcarbamoyl transferase component Bud32
MPLDAGTRLGPYEIVDAIGAGGMGEVYKARDTRLDRIVAIKTSKEQFTERFEREARNVAALNHPNICTLFDVGPNYLVMEFIEGPTLAERIAAGRIPLEEARPIVRQIIDALEAAHEKGIVHRDLKPANIKLTPDGKVKVLDFGLAKAFDNESTATSPNSPTLTMGATRAGVILGTAAYMSPEQARGVMVDKRADIWSFGVVLLEMLTGRAPFSGETLSDTLAAVLRAEFDWSALPADTPPGVRRLLRRCLERDRKIRLRDIGDARADLDEPPSAAPAAAPSRNPRWLVAALALALLVAAALALVHFRETEPPPPAMARFDLPLPPKTSFGQHVSISPDGHWIAFVAAAEGGSVLIWVRPVDGLEARALPGTDNAGYLFWSPDSRSIAYWAAGKLKRVEATGGPVQTICDATFALGGAWSREGFIVFGSNTQGLSIVPVSGGTPKLVTNAPSSWPFVLPDGRHFLYLADITSGPLGKNLHLAAVDSNLQVVNDRTLYPASSAAYFVPAPDSHPGHILYLREDTLMAQPFDARRLELAGEARPVVEHVGGFLTRPYFAASLTGTVIYRSSSGAGSATHLEWRDRSGKLLSTFGASRLNLDVSLAHDPAHIAVSRTETGGIASDIWVLDSNRGTSTKLTSNAAIQMSPVWSPDDSRLAFASGAPARIMWKNSSGTGTEETLLSLDNTRIRPCDWSRDGKYLLYVVDLARKHELWVLPLEKGGKPMPYLQAESGHIEGQFAPDVHLVAYASDESGTLEIYVQPFPASGGKWQISTGGGTQPRWRADGRELYYLAPDRTLMAVEIKTAPKFEAGIPKALFPSRVLALQSIATGSFRYAPTPDGKRFLTITAEQEAVDTPLTVILNWRPGSASK